MERIYASEQRFWGETDSQTIQNAIDYASAEGLGEVIIPRRNERTGEKIWIIERAIVLPSDMTVILDNCHLRHADGVVDNIFRNRTLWTEEGKTLEGEQHDIRILGHGRAILDGGKPNGMCEQLLRDNPGKYPSMRRNCPIHMSNVRNFEVSGIQFLDTRYWALCFSFCRWGHIHDLGFRMYGTLENQDGIDLRAGCEYITIENINGVTGDDTVALTALAQSSVAKELAVKGKSMDIHDITIRNVIATTHGCGIVRFLCEGGAREYNITVDGIKDTADSISGTSIIIGTSDNHFCDPPHVMGDFKNIVMKNITTCGQRAISIAEACQDVIIENLFAYGPGEIGIRFYKNFECDNLTIRNVYIRSHEETLDSIFWMNPNPDRVMKNLKVENVYASKARYVFRGVEFPVENFTCEEPSEGWFTEEGAKLRSAYGRYHYMSYGKVFTERPADNRFDGTLKTPTEIAR